MIVLIMVVLHSFDRRVATTTKTVMIYIEYAKVSAIRRITAFAKEHQITIDDVQMEAPDPTRTTNSAAVLYIRLPKRALHAELIEQIIDIEGVVYAEEL
jgi:hypothetical protein